MRLSIEGGPVVDNNDYGDVDRTPVANWDFAENAGTTLRNTINDGLTDPATWTADRAGITATGEDELNFAPNTNTMDGSVTYFDLAGAGNAFTTGKAWTVMEINDFNFAGATIGERLRFGLMNAMTNGSLTAECQIRRNANNSIHLMGYASGTMPGTGVQISNSNTFSGQLEICTEFDFDARTYQVFYRFNGTGEWN